MRLLPLAAALAQPAFAHESAERSLPDQPGLRLGAALALSLADAREPWPAARLPGIYSSGSTPVDRRNGALEHATVDLGMRATSALGLALAWGFHDNDPPHVEAAWAQWDMPLQDDASLQAGAGRNRLPMGRILEGGGHFDRFGAMPLAKRAAIDGDWVDDGANLRWQRSHDGIWPALQTVDLGLWHPRRFPGGPGTPWAPALHARLVLGDWAFDGFASHLQPPRRGAYIQSDRAAHTHAVPDCSSSLVGITCFEGRSDLLAGSASWDLPWQSLRLEAAGLLRRDRGLLYSASGEAQYRGNTGGGWLDLLWPATPRLSLALRGETVRSVQRLQGAGALAVATDAGLLGSTRIWRASAALAYAPQPSLRLSLEAGTDRQGGRHNNFTALRLLWTPESLWGWSW